MNQRYIEQLLSLIESILPVLDRERLITVERALSELAAGWCAVDVVHAQRFRASVELVIAKAAMAEPPRAAILAEEASARGKTPGARYLVRLAAQRVVKTDYPDGAMLVPCTLLICRQMLGMVAPFAQVSPAELAQALRLLCLDLPHPRPANRGCTPPESATGTPIGRTGTAS